jgi:hypothetical protein
MNLEELEAKVTFLEDIQQIERLQRIYGYYVDYGEWDKVIDLFSDDTESVEVIDHGLYLGKAGVRRFFGGLLGRSKREGVRQPGILALVLQLQGVVDIDPDGKTAKGRWQAIELSGRPVTGTPRPMWGLGVYENEYVKEDGKWKFKKLHYNQTFMTPYEDGWLKTPFAPPPGQEQAVPPDLPSTAFHPFPSGYHFPYHFKHPITGE